MPFYQMSECKKNCIALVAKTGEMIDYQTLFERVDEIVSFLLPRRIAFVFCKNDEMSILAYLAMLQAKVVPVLVRQSLPPEHFDKLLKQYRPQYLFLPNLQIGESLYGYEIIWQKEGYVLLSSTKDMNYHIHPDLALLLTTSGSTGSPKLVRQSYKNILSNTSAIAEYLEIDARSRLITTLPMYYTYGLSMIQTHLAMGASIILNESAITEKFFWQQLKKYSATTFGGVPYTYEMLKKLRFERMDLPSLRVITQAGGRLSPEFVEYFGEVCDKKNIRFFVMYGAAEATARMSYLPPVFVKEKAGSIGIAIPHGQFFLEDEKGHRLLTRDGVGELVYSGDNVMMGYAQNYHDLLLGDEQQGVLHTGDMARHDSEGFYYIVGRKKRFLKIYGNRVNLMEVEEILCQAGYDCACTGEDDRMNIYLTNQEGKEDVCTFISRKLGLNQSAFFSYTVETIPRNEAGKILYGELEIIKK